VPTFHDPIAFELLGLQIRWYGLFILTGILVGVSIVRWLALQRGLDPEFALDAAPIVIVAAVIGARLYYLILRNDYYRENPGELVSLQLQGLTIHGALIGGILAFVYLCHRRGQPFWTWSDIVIAAVPIGQAIGRLGNWANQEAFGTPTDLPWAVHIDPANRPGSYPDAETFHPTFLYEGILNLLIAALLIRMVLQVPKSRRLHDGDVLGAYCILYGIARLIIERVRTDSLYIGPLPAAYWLSGALILIGLAIIILRRILQPASSGNLEHNVGAHS